MVKPRTLVILAATGGAVYALWRWQWQRLVAFDKSLFQNSSEENKRLAPGFSVQPEKGSGKGRPIPTKVHRGAPPDPGKEPRTVVRTTVHKGEPPRVNAAEVEPHFADSAKQHTRNEAEEPQPASARTGEEASE